MNATEKKNVVETTKKKVQWKIDEENARESCDSSDFPIQWNISKNKIKKKISEIECYLV